MATYQFVPNLDIGPSEEFDWFECKILHKCNILRDFSNEENLKFDVIIKNMKESDDPIGYIINLYLNEEQKFANYLRGQSSYKGHPCIDIKWSLDDCVCGCHNEVYSPNQGTHTAPHQRRLHMVTKYRLPKLLKEQEFNPDTILDFENLFDWVAQAYEGFKKGDPLKGYKNQSYPGQIHIYDTAVRIGKNMLVSYGREVMPKDYVYLHCGAWLGARHIQKIQRLLGKQTDIFQNTYVSPNSRLKIRNFSHRLQELGSYHIENFLCCYHNALGGYAKDLKQNKTTKLK